MRLLGRDLMVRGHDCFYPGLEFRVEDLGFRVEGFLGVYMQNKVLFGRCKLGIGDLARRL